MKRIEVILATVMMVLCGCSEKIETPDNSSAGNGKQKVTFAVSKLLMEPETRGALSNEGMTDFWIYENGTELAHQVSTDDKFGQVTLEMEYGEHTLSFLTTKADVPTISNGVWSCEKIKPTFGKVADLDVDEKVKVAVVDLDMLTGKLNVKIEDEIPANANTLSVVINPYATTLTVGTLAAGGSQSKTYDIDLSEKVGLKNCGFNIYYLQSGQATVTMTVKDAQGQTIVSHSVTGALNKGESNVIHGNFFDSSAQLSVSLNTDFTKNNDIEI